MGLTLVIPMLLDFWSVHEYIITTDACDRIYLLDITQEEKVRWGIDFGSMNLSVYFPFKSRRPALLQYMTVQRLPISPVIDRLSTQPTCPPPASFSVSAHEDKQEIAN